MDTATLTAITKTKPSGPVPCVLMVVGEAPGYHEEVKGVPFVGQSGDEFDKMLVEAKYIQPLDASNAEERRTLRDSSMFLTNVCKYRPPENKIENFFLDKKRTKPNELILEGLRELQEEIRYVQPNLILALGDTALWGLTGKHGITKWRGSMLEYEYTALDGSRRVALLMPTYHPALILREWSWRPIATHDMRRARTALLAGSWPERRTSYLIRPAFETVMDTLGTLVRKANDHSPEAPLPLTSDIETRGGFIACHGIAWSSLEAICIPNLCVERPTGYFTLDQDIAIWERERTLLTHPNVSVTGQNYLYDAQYFARRKGYVPRLRHDTMCMQHTAFPGLPKSLAFMSSMYCQHHVYWKDEGKEWNAKVPEDNLWIYNCDDAARTFEIALALEQTLRRLGLWEIYQFQMQLWPSVLEAMLRGVRIDQLLRGKVAAELMQATGSREQRLQAILGYKLDIGSWPQVHNLFYEQLRCKKVLNRKTKKPTCDEDALRIFVSREPLLKPITDLIVDLRALGAMMSNVVLAQISQDGRMRSSFNPYSGEAYRWTSSKDAWGGGSNMQNWTKGDEDKEASAIQHTFPIPNVRKLIIPDQGFDIGSIDLTGADAQAVAWESGDEDLKNVFKENKIKIHAHNARTFYGTQLCPTGYEQPYYDRMRTGVHLVHYVGGADVLAAALQCSKYEAQDFINQWFELHPAIPAWHDKIQDQLMRTRQVQNAFGYRRFFFDRIEGLLPDAIAWIGQSTTSCVTNRAWVRLAASQELRAFDFQLLFQVHDEIIFQYPSFYRNKVLSLVRSLAHITVPYEDPLIIPWGLKTSTKSWGDCAKRDWPE